MVTGTQRQKKLRMAKAQAHKEQINENGNICTVHCDITFVMYLKS